MSNTGGTDAVGVTSTSGTMTATATDTTTVVLFRDGFEDGGDGDGRLDPDPSEGAVAPVYYTIYEWD